MIYWGLSKTRYHQRTQFHKLAELFIEKQIDRMLANNEVPDHKEPVDVFDQILQTSAVMVHRQGFSRALKISK